MDLSQNAREIAENAHRGTHIEIGLEEPLAQALLNPISAVSGARLRPAAASAKSRAQGFLLIGKRNMRSILALLVAGALATPAFADETEGLILSFDRVDRIIVMTDLTVWEVPASVETPDDLGKGDRIHIVYDSAGDDGIIGITAVHRLASAVPAGTDGGS